MTDYAPEDAEDSIIALLDDDTANRIAAGEVVERPSSVVKELVENALDSGATRIEVELSEGGKRKILVRDNGHGMSRTDGILALQRHATSKIRSADDLFAIHTFGFRGEAIPSIASVSDFCILTKRAQDDAATEILVRGGEIVSVESAGATDGTTVLVENLFYNVPARLKFLKGTPTELSNAAEWIHRLLLANPKTAFRLTSDGHHLINYPGGGSDLDAIAAFWGREAARQMVPLRYESPDLRVHGYISKPSLTKTKRDAQAMFVNGRFVRSRTMTAALDGAYQELMKSDRFPVAALFVEVLPNLVDVNVHPAKTEVRFTRDGDVFQVVRRAVSDALLSGGLVPEVRTQATLPVQNPALALKPALSSFATNRVDMTQSESEPVTDSLDLNVLVRGQQTLAIEPTEIMEPSAYIGFDGQRIEQLRIIGQARNTYIVAETNDSVLLIDQHIAHERVLYEQLMNGAEESARRYGVVAQHLAIPQTLEFDPRTARIVVERLETLAKAGFVMEAFGGASFLVRAVPAVVANKDYLQILRDLAGDLAEATTQRRLLIPHEAALIMASCKLAVKKGDPLTMDEMTRLLSDLSRMRNPFTCPHGRPILIALPHNETDRKFHRIGTH